MKWFIVGFMLFLYGVCFAHVPQEMLFDHLLVSYEKQQDGTDSRVVLACGMGDFNKHVLENKKPVIVKVFMPGKEGFWSSVYQSIAPLFKGKVSFVGMDAAHNEDVLRAIMMRLRMTQVNLPLFLFFKERTLLLPLVTGVSSKQALTNIIQKQFFARTFQQDKSSASSLSIKSGNIKGGAVLDVDQKKMPVDKKEELSTWEKLQEIGEKLKNSLVGLQDVSKEIQAYHLSKRRKPCSSFTKLP